MIPPHTEWQIASGKEKPLTHTLRLRRTGLSATETLADLRHKGRGRKERKMERKRKGIKGAREKMEERGDGLHEKGNGGIIIDYG
mgnify:CR=1 FL=1